MNLPEFKVMTNQAEWDEHARGFGTYMIRCTRKNDRFNIPPKITVLMFIVKSENAEQMKSWSGIRQFLEISGYEIEDVQMTEPREADLLFICTDKEEDEDVKYMVYVISQGLLGLEPKHEILVSTPVRYANAYGVFPYRPMMLNFDFMAYGMCMIHTHIRTLHDPGMKVGRHIAMMLELEGKLLRAGVAQAKNAAVAYNKIAAFKLLLESRGHDGGEARWVFATLDLLRHTRNILGHTPPPKRALNGYKEAVEKLNRLAAEYGRPFGEPSESDIQDRYGIFKKWMTQLTQITSLWIDEYLKDNPVKTGVASGPTS